MRHSVVLVSLLILFCAVVATLFLSGDEFTVLLPILVSASVTLPALYILYLRNGSVPLEDIGALYIAVIGLYTVVPLATYLARGMMFTKYSDPRLLEQPPMPSEMARIGWLHVLYCAACVVSYLWAGRDLKLRPAGRLQLNVDVNASVFPVCVVLLVLVQIFVTGFALAYGVEGGTYNERNLSLAQAYLSAPQILKQLHVHAEGMVIILKMAVLIFLFRRFRTYRWVIFSWYAAEVILAVTGLGARTPLVYLTLVMAILYHRLVKPFPVPVALLGGSLFIGGYLLFGFVRSFGDTTAADATLLNSSNEFEAMFANAFDLYRQIGSGVLAKPPLSVHFSDFLSFFPSQILPFEKLDGATWYIRLQGVENTGRGYAFGVISESAIGWGWAELLVKGLLMGYLMAWVSRWYLGRRNEYWPLMVYVYLEIVSYHCFRSSSFYFIPMMLLRFLPVYLIVRLLTRKSAALAPAPAIRLQVTTQS